MAQEEVAARAGRSSSGCERELQAALLPHDPDDERNVFLEIRAGTGGDESALFAGDLLRMYLRYCRAPGLASEIDLARASASSAATRKWCCASRATTSTRSCKFESGGHRVQRVPATETQGRIHTCACTVAVLPEPDEAEEVTLNPADLRIDTFRASGAGGQHVNKTDSAVRITHLPTGIVVECQDDRSQHRNKAQGDGGAGGAPARQASAASAQRKEAATRKCLIGSGDRSDRIRTYNFPQGRLTDHRINLTLYKLQLIMDGDLDEVIAALQAARARRAARRARERRGMTTVDAARWRWHARCGVDRLDAQLLLAHGAGRGRAPGCWRTTTRRSMPTAQARRSQADCARRAAGEPLAYLLGEKEFHGLMLQVTPDVLVPRPDTETLVDWALELLAAGLPRRGRACVDLGTGSGAIALAVAAGVPAAPR